jgi:hypothetical protein
MPITIPEYRTGPIEEQKSQLANPSYASKTSSPGTGGGWFIPLLEAVGIPILGAIGKYFSTKAQMEGERQAATYDRETALLLERMRIDAARELDRERRRLPDWAYRQLKQIVSTPLTPHGGGAPAGSFQQAVTPRTPTAMPTGGGMGGGQFGSQLKQPERPTSPIFQSRMPVRPAFMGGR